VVDFPTMLPHVFPFVRPRLDVRGGTGMAANSVGIDAATDSCRWRSSSLLRSWAKWLDYPGTRISPGQHNTAPIRENEPIVNGKAHGEGGAMGFGWMLQAGSRPPPVQNHYTTVCLKCKGFLHFFRI